MSIPKVIIAGTHSGVGKTSVSLAVMAAFTKNGYRVQAYKVGPDYIDPSYHEMATQRPSHNLDDWMMGSEAVKWLFKETSRDCDVAVIEGVMGLFDGFGTTNDEGSTAKIAKMLQCPVILIVDASSMARSVAAIVKGYQTLDEEIKIVGVILNRVASVNHFQILRESIAHYNQCPVIGAIFRDKKIVIPERHLGLKPASENKEFRQCLESLMTFVEMKPQENSCVINLQEILNLARKYSSDIESLPSGEFFINYHKISKNLSFPNAFPPKVDQPQAEVGNLDEVMTGPPTETFGGDNFRITSRTHPKISRQTFRAGGPEAGSLPPAGNEDGRVPQGQDPQQIHRSNFRTSSSHSTDLLSSKVRVAYAKDRAFHFYYQANLDVLNSYGAQLVPFSPLEDNHLPEDIHALYFGGGFPEIYADELEKNSSMKESVKKAIQNGMPTYAECGGLMYLTEGIKTLEGKVYKMVGLIPGFVEMTSRLVNFGYCENELIKDCFLGKQGERFRGHEFHYSRWEAEGIESIHRVDKKRRQSSRAEGYQKGNLLASYVHCHFLSYPKRALGLIETARSFAKANTVSEAQLK